MVKCRYEGMGVWADRCMATREVDPCVGYDKCKNYKPNCKTNADRIRAMSDEELADLLSAPCPLLRRFDDKGCPNPKPCRECIADWLKQPAEEKQDEV